MITPKPLPFITTYYGNYNCTQMSNKFQIVLSTTQNDRIKQVFDDTRTVLALRQPPNILRQISKAEFISDPHVEEND